MVGVWYGHGRCMVWHGMVGYRMAWYGYSMEWHGRGMAW